MKFGAFALKNNRSNLRSVGYEKVTERQLSIQNKENGSDATVTLIETPPWSGSLPESRFILDLVQLIQSRRGVNPQAVIITCNDGATESGLICVMCNVMERLEVDGDVDIMAAVRQLQIRRPQCIPSENQYSLCYLSVKEHLDATTVYANV